MAWPASSPGGRPAVPARVPRGGAWASPLAPRPPLPSPSVTPAFRPPPSGRPGPLRPEGVHLRCPHTAAGRVHVCGTLVCVCAGVLTAACTHQDVSGCPAAPTRPARGAVAGQPRAPPCSEPGPGSPGWCAAAVAAPFGGAAGRWLGGAAPCWPRRHSPRLLGLGPGAGPVSHIVTTFEGAPVQSWGAHPVTLAASVQVPGGSRCGQNLGGLAGRPVLRSGQNCAWCWGWRAPLPRPAWQCPGHPAPLRETGGPAVPSPQSRAVLTLGGRHPQADFRGTGV